MSEAAAPLARVGARLNLARWRRWGTLRSALLVAASLPMLLFFALPLLALVLRSSIADLLAGLLDAQVAQAIQLSATTTLATTTLTLLTGTPVAFLLARRSFPGHAIIDTLVDLPMLLPPAVAGVALLLTFGRRGVLGAPLTQGGVSIAFTTAAVVLAQTFVAAPFYVRAARAAFASVDRDLEDAAAVDGAAPFAIFHRITLPLSASALFGGAVMTWARALGEFGATIIFAGNFPGRTQTMPLAIYIGFELDLRVALTLSVILLLTSFLVLLIVKRVLRQPLTLAG